jgi:hypothetical protein
MIVERGKAPLVRPTAEWLRPRSATRRRRRSSRNADGRVAAWRPAPSTRRMMRTALVCSAILLVMALGIFLVLGRA